MSGTEYASIFSDYPARWTSARDLLPPTRVVEDRILAEQAEIDEAVGQLPSEPIMRRPVPSRQTDLPSLPRRAAQAVKAIGQNLIRVNQRTPEEIQRIAAICRPCDQRSQHGFCNLCWCHLGQKIRNAGTACPAGRWGPA